MALTADGSPLDDATLAAHLDFVRRLARALVRDESAADDLAQETWITALRSPPREGFAWKGWLGGIARRLAWRAHRGEERRARHERSGAEGSVGGHEPPAAETAALLELSQRVIAELHALGEPYATTVRRRFLDGLAADEIARLEGVPVETVRTRVKRALAQLRQRLDEKHGGRRDAWAGVLVPWAGSVVMGVKAKLAVAALVIAAVGGVGWWTVAGARSTTPDGSAKQELALATPPKSDEVGLAQPTSLDTAALAARREATPLGSRSPLPGCILHGRITDPEGKPVPDLYLNVDAESPETAQRTLRVAADGTFALVSLTPGLWRLWVGASDGFESLDRWVKVAERPTVQHVDLVLQRSLLVPICFTTPEGERFIDVISESERSRMLRGIGLVATVDEPRRDLEPDSNAKHHLAGRAFVPAHLKEFGQSTRLLEFGPGVDALLRVPHLPIHVAAYYKHVRLDSAFVTSVDEGARLVFSPAEIEECLATVTVRFVDADRRDALRHGHVALRVLQGSRSVDPDPTSGIVRFEQVAPGRLFLERWEDDHEPFATFVTIAPGSDVDLGDVAVAKRVDVAVRVVNAAGEGMQATVSGIPLDGPGRELPHEYAHSMGTDDAGRGKVALGPHRALLIARGQGAGADGPPLESRAVVVDASSGVGPNVELVLVPATRGRFELHAHSESSLIAEVIDPAQRVVRRRELLGPASWRDSLPPGRYRFSVRDGDHERGTCEVVIGDAPFTARLAVDGHSIAEAPRTVVDAVPTESVVVDAGGGAARRDRGTLLHGTLVDRGGQPIANGSVSVFDARGASRSASSGSDGVFAVADVSAGSCELTIRATGFAEQQEQLAVEAHSAALRHDFVLDRVVRIPVRFVAPDGRSLVKALLDEHRRGVMFMPDRMAFGVVPTREAIEGEAPAGRGRRFRGSAGRFEPRLDGETLDGVVELDGEPPFVANAVLGRRVLGSQVVASAVDEIVFTIDPEAITAARGTLRWSVVAASTGARLELSHVQLGNPSSTSYMPADRFRQDDGSYAIDGLDGGSWRLGFSVPDHERIERSIEIESGGIIDLGAIPLDRSVMIEARLVDDEGRPVTAELVATEAGSTIRLGGEFQGDGNYKFRGLGPRCWRVSLTDDRFAWQSWLVDASSGDVRGLQWVATPGTRVSVTVGANRWRSFAITVKDETGNHVVERVRDGSSPLRFALRSGRYRVALSEDGVDRGEHDLIVGAEPVTVTLPMK